MCSSESRWVPKTTLQCESFPVNPLKNWQVATTVEDAALILTDSRLFLLSVDTGIQSCNMIRPNQSLVSPIQCMIGQDVYMKSATSAKAAYLPMSLTLLVIPSAIRETFRLVSGKLSLSVMLMLLLQSSVSDEQCTVPTSSSSSESLVLSLEYWMVYCS